MVTVLYVILLTVAFFWVGIFLGRGYRTSRTSLSFTLPAGAKLFREGGPPRRTERVNLSVPISVAGADAKGERFEESTHTVNISGHGASILLKHEVKLGDEFTLRRMDKSSEAAVRVLHLLTRSEEGNLYGVAFVDPAADLWGACKLLTEAMQQNAAKAAASEKQKDA